MPAQRPERPFSYWEPILAETKLDQVGLRERDAVVPMMLDYIYSKERKAELAKEQAEYDRKQRQRTTRISILIGIAALIIPFTGTLLANKVSNSQPQVIYVPVTPIPSAAPTLTPVPFPTPR